MKKGFISLLICGCMCTGMVNTYAVSSESKIFSEEAGLVSGLGIMSAYEDGSVGAEDAVTREEFAGIIYRLMRLAGNSENNVFSDVDDSPYKKEINVLTDMGIFSGTGDGKFRPNERISGPSAIKTTLLALNFKPYSDVYPDGYTETARLLGLLDETENIVYSEYITHDEAARLIYNALTSSYYIEYDNGYPKYQSGGTPIIEKSFDIALIDGIIEENDCGGLYSDTKLGDGRIRIGDTTINAPEYRNMIGQRVKLYYNKDTMNGVYAYNGKNDFMTLSSDDMSFRDGKLYRDTGSSEKEVKLDKHHICIYNFEPVGFMSEKYVPINGTAELIDNDQDGDYDVIKVSDYKSYRIKSVNEKEIYFNKADGAYLDLKGKNVDADFNLEDVAANDVLSYFEHNDSVKAVLSKETVSGKVESAYDSDGKHYGIIAGEKYKLLNTDNYDYMGGAEAVYYLDFMGNIVDADEGKSSMTGGYLVGFYSEPVKDKIYAKIYVSGDEPTHYPLAEKYMLDGRSVKTSTIDLKTAAADKVPSKNQLVRFKKNEDGEIVFIDTADTRSNNVDDKLIKVYDGSARFKTSCGNFGGVICATKSTKLIGVSKDKTEFLIKNYNKLENDGNYSIKAYTISENSLTATYIVMDITDSDFAITNETTPAIVKNIDTALDGDDCEATRLTVLHGGEEKSLFVSEEYEGDISKLDKGDVIRFSLDMHDRIVRVQQHFDCSSESTIGKNPSTGFSEWFRTVYGTVTKKDGNVIQITAKNSETGDEITEVHTANQFKIYVVDMSGKEPIVSSGSVSNIRSEQEASDKASKVFIQTRYGDPKVMIVYNN